MADARRCKAAANRAMFRSKMLEHRRLQAQLLQLQRYRESALAHLDAVSNHEINKSFMRAIRSTVSLSDDRKEAEEAMDGLSESISHVKDLSELLGQSVLVEEVTDEDLEHEFDEFIITTTEEENSNTMISSSSTATISAPIKNTVDPSSNHTAVAAQLIVPALLG